MIVLSFQYRDNRENSEYAHMNALKKLFGSLMYASCKILQSLSKLVATAEDTA